MDNLKELLTEKSTVLFVYTYVYSVNNNIEVKCFDRKCCL